MNKLHRFVLALVVGTLATLSVLSGQTTGFRFVAWGDTKSGTDVLSRLSDQVKTLSPQPVLTIYVGDLVDGGFDQSLMDTWKSALNGELTGSNTSNGTFDKTFAVRGNHDSSNLSGWQSFFNFASVASSVGATNFQAHTTDTVYSFDYGNSRFIGLDALGNAQKLTSDQIAWLDTKLTEAEALHLTHAFIFFHGPIYCVDGHCSCTNNPTCVSEGDDGPVTDVINKHPIVSATFHGHEHVYAHVYLDNTRMTRLASGRSFHEFVTGAAGAGPDTCEAGRTDYCMPEWGFVTVDVNGATVTANFYQDSISTSRKTVSFTKGTVPPGDTAPPTVSITAPGNGATVSGTATVTASATDAGSGVKSVEFLLDGATSLGTDTASSYSVDWNTTTVSDGSHNLTAKATDNAGNTATSAPVSVNVSNGAGATVPAAPSNLTARAASASQINLTWIDNSNPPNDETGFEVERSTVHDFSADTTTIPVAANTNTLADNTVAPKTRYYYRVRANNSVGHSAWSSAASVRTHPH